MTTREVVVEVVATDRHKHPVSDMRESDFQIFEVKKWSQKTPQNISAFHVIDPALARSHLDAPSAGFRLTSGGGCAVSTTFHYQLAFNASPDSGYHEILVTTSRPHVRLSFRHRYYVGETNVPSTPRLRKADVALQEAACSHSGTPPSISLTARLVQTGSTDSLRYSLVVQADSLAFIAVSDETRRVQLDYGICTFDAEGMPLKYMQTSVERVLTSPEYDRALVHGFPNLLEFPDWRIPLGALRCA